VGNVKKLTVSTLGFLILFAFSLSTPPLHAEKALDAKVSVFIASDQIHEDLPAPDSDEKKLPYISQTVILLLLVLFIFYKYFPTGSFSALFAFLTAVFFQSNYVIKPLGF
jgi:hypothetical protein